VRPAALAVCLALAAAAPAAADTLIHVDPPRPRGSELPPLPRGPVPPFGGASGAASHAIGCPRETLFEINRILAFLHALPLGEAWVELATPEFEGICG
jgi:hypothetical protein